MENITDLSVRAQTELAGAGGSFDPGGSLRFPIAATTASPSTISSRRPA